MSPTLTPEQELSLLRWRPIDTPVTLDDVNEYCDIEFANEHDIWQGNFASASERSKATHWRPITLPGAYNSQH